MMGEGEGEGEGKHTTGIGQRWRRRLESASSPSLIHYTPPNASPHLCPLLLWMTDKSNPGPPPSPTTPTAGKLLRRSNSDRLRMHAPSSIKIAAPTAGRVLEWKTAIPLLSPLDPTVEIGRWEEDEGGEGNVVVAGGTTELRWSTWQHPAAPFSYEPVPPDPAGLLLPHCA